MTPREEAVTAGRCLQCGKECRLTANGKPVPHKSGNPEDWYMRQPINGPAQWCIGEGFDAMKLDEPWP